MEIEDNRSPAGFIVFTTPGFKFLIPKQRKSDPAVADFRFAKLSLKKETRCICLGRTERLLPMLQHVLMTISYMGLRISDGLSEASVRLEARLTTSSKDQQQARFLIVV
jgi:hypothetical protein